MRRHTKEKDETLKNEEIKIMEKFIEQIEAVDVHLPKFTNIMSRFMLLKYYTVLKYFNVNFVNKLFRYKIKIKSFIMCYFLFIQTLRITLQKIYLL